MRDSCEDKTYSPGGTKTTVAYNAASHRLTVAYKQNRYNNP